MAKDKILALFEAYGVELEYMIVDKDSLVVLPIADQILKAVAGEITDSVEIGEVAWSNELVLHVIELKTNGPSTRLNNLPKAFQENVDRINNILENLNAKLLPTGAHPFMHPVNEAKLWPHDYNIIYESYNTIFDCRGHGWSNLQSTHLNLPFANDQEFVQLHTAIRLLLPIMPALSASTPILDGKVTDFVDTRLVYYRTNQQKIPSITGLVIPEAVRSIQEYHDKILQPMYRDIAMQDKHNVLQYEWLNSRGAIARFDRNAIEIRILDIQECPQADLAIMALITATLKSLIAETWLSMEKQLQFSEQELSEIFNKVIKDGQEAIITNQAYLQAFNYQERPFATAKDLWQHILNEQSVTSKLEPVWAAVIDIILTEGNLAERILRSLPDDFEKPQIIAVYQQLAECLRYGNLFLPKTD